MIETQERERARAALEAGISPVVASGALRSALAEACVDAFRETRWPTFPPGTIGFMHPVSYWVVRDEGLKLVESFCAAVVGLAGTQFAVGNVTAASVVSVLAGAFNFLWKLHQKRAYLTIDQREMLVAMKTLAVPSTLEEIARSLGIDAVETDATLNSLTAIRCVDGNVMAVVARDSTGRWACAGI